MFKSIMIASALCAVALASASAADIIRPAPASPSARFVTAPAPDYWTGFYLGVDGGYAKNGDAKGGFGGLQIGYDQLINQQWLIGVRTDLALASLKHTIDGCGVPGICASETAKTMWLGSTVAKIGFVPTSAPNVAIYGVGGVAYKHTNYRFSVTGLVHGADSNSATKAAFTAGGGLAYAFNTHVNVGLEYNWVHFPGDTPHYIIAGIGGDVPHPGANEHLVKASINYRF